MKGTQAVTSERQTWQDLVWLAQHGTKADWTAVREAVEKAAKSIPGKEA